MGEDWYLDEEYHVESVGEFYEGLDEDERYFARKMMTPCSNCGEMRPKNDKYIRSTGMCYLCSKDEDHQDKRGRSHNASLNAFNLEGIVDEWKKLQN